MMRKPSLYDLPTVGSFLPTVGNKMGNSYDDVGGRGQRVGNSRKTTNSR
jgi:hypothetical protein